MIFVVIGLAAAIVTASADLSSLLSLDSSRVLSGEVWRVFSGHLAHLTWRQLFLDVSTFIVLYQTYTLLSGAASAVLLSLFSAMIVSAGVIVSGLHDVYGGLSGLSCAALSAILLMMIMTDRHRALASLLAAVFCLYLLSTKGITNDVPIAREAHIAGAISGIVFALIHFRLKKPVRSILDVDHDRDRQPAS